MPYLVSPDTLVFSVPDEKALAAVISELQLPSFVARNLHQLLGWTSSGEGRPRRQEAGNFQLLEDVKWLKHETSGQWAPAVGKFEHIWESLVQRRTDMDFSRVSLRKLLGTAKRTVSGWHNVDPPPQLLQRLATVADGSSLQLLFAPMPHQQPQAQVGAQQVRHPHIRLRLSALLTSGSCCRRTGSHQRSRRGEVEAVTQEKQSRR
jgi:hypothetical protein